MNWRIKYFEAEFLNYVTTISRGRQFDAKEKKDN